MNYGVVRYSNKLRIHLYQGLLFLLLIIQISCSAALTFIIEHVKRRVCENRVKVEERQVIIDV